MTVTNDILNLDLTTLTLEDCKSLQRLVEKYVGFKFDEYEAELAEHKAIDKLNYIINRFGDANGERTQDYYLAQLIAEQIKQSRFSEYCRRDCEKKYKKRSA